MNIILMNLENAEEPQNQTNNSNIFPSEMEIDVVINKPCTITVVGEACLII